MQAQSCPIAESNFFASIFFNKVPVDRKTAKARQAVISRVACESMSNLTEVLLL